MRCLQEEKEEEKEEENVKIRKSRYVKDPKHKKSMEGLMKDRKARCSARYTF